MTNILELVKGYFSDELLQQAAGFVGEETTTTQAGLNHILPSLLGSFISKSSNKSGAGELFDLISKPEFSGGLLNNLSGLFTANSTSESTGAMGANLLTSLMGGQENVIGNLVSSATGMKSGAVSKLSSLVTPILLSVIGKKVKTDGLGLDAFTSMLQGQQGFVQDALPESFGNELLGSLGLSKIQNAGSGIVDGAKESIQNVTNEVKETAQEVKDNLTPNKEEKEDKKGFLGRILPILLLLLALLFAFLLWKNGKKKGENDKQNQIENNQASDDSADDNVLSIENLYLNGEELIGKSVKGFEYLGTFMKKQLKNGVQLILPSKGGVSQLIDFIEDDNAEVSTDKWFELRRLVFETGSSTLKPESQVQVNNLAEILKAYPNVNLKIGGYTDNTGSLETNLQVSTERANAVMNSLIEKGIDASRLEAEGYGPEHPVASNDTEEGREKNRRVAVRVTEK